MITYLVATALFLILGGCAKPSLTPAPSPAEAARPEARVSYIVVEVKDVSFAAAIRKSVKVAMNKGLNKQEIEWIAYDVVKQITKQQPVNAVMIFMYHNGDDYSGVARISVEWAPYGDWGRASEVKTGDYKSHQYRYRPQDTNYSYWPAPSSASPAQPPPASKNQPQEQPHTITELGSVKLELIGEKGILKFEFLVSPILDKVSPENLAEALMLEWHQRDEVRSLILDDRDAAELYLSKYDDLGKLSLAEMKALINTIFPHIGAEYVKNRLSHCLTMLSRDTEVRAIRELKLPLAGKR